MPDPAAPSPACFTGSVARNPWDAQTYDSQFGFVSRYGDDLLDLLGPGPGERILDLGCGTGRHAAAMAARGALVVGMDLDADMLAKASLDHPGIPFVAADAAAFALSDLGVDRPFDACFSNAALHWMQPADAVLGNVRSVLADAGRFVAEMGGAGNIAAVDAALRAALHELGLGDLEVTTNDFPTLGEQAVRLERAGFRVEQAAWFARPTPLEQGTTPADWTRHFRAGVWLVVPPALEADLARAVDAHAQARGLRSGDLWIADYCRLRFVAVCA